MFFILSVNIQEFAAEKAGKSKALFQQLFQVAGMREKEKNRAD